MHGIPQVIYYISITFFLFSLHNAGENGVVVTPLNVHSYLPIEQERKLAAALAPVTCSTHMNNNNNNNNNNGEEGNDNNGDNGNEALAVSEEEFLEAATAGMNYAHFMFC